MNLITFKKTNLLFLNFKLYTLENLIDIYLGPSQFVIVLE